MFIKQKLPLQLFCILEKVKPIVWTSETNLPNHYYVFVPSNWIVTISKILKKETSFCQTFLTDVTAIDSSHYTVTGWEVDSFLKKNKKFPLYNYYCLTTKTRLTFILELAGNYEVESIDSIFRGAGWAERELSEMYGITYRNKQDTRKILLDYSAEYNPLCKDFSVENSQDIFYDLVSEKISYKRNNFIEL